MVEYIDINGANLAYKLTGPDGAPLILTLHGGRGFGEHLPIASTYTTDRLYRLH
jgi:hypothetical protein